MPTYKVWYQHDETGVTTLGPILQLEATDEDAVKDTYIKATDPEIWWDNWNAYQQAMTMTEDYEEAVEHLKVEEITLTPEERRKRFKVVRGGLTT